MTAINLLCPRAPDSGVRLVDEDEDPETGPMTEVWLLDQLTEDRATEIACERVWRAYTRRHGL